MIYSLMQTAGKDRSDWRYFGVMYSALGRIIAFLTLHLTTFLH
jgi:hypothetical protein